MGIMRLSREEIRRAKAQLYLATAIKENKIIIL